jgi:hypothetical protein
VCITLSLITHVQNISYFAVQRRFMMYRYVAQNSSNVTALEMRDAWNVTVGYYLKARALDPSNGKLHNQLAVVEELQAGDGLHVCMGACMRFALAVCAVKPLVYGEKNWIRCIGNHRDAVSECLPPSRLGSLAPNSMYVQMRTMLALMRMSERNSVFSTAKPPFHSSLYFAIVCLL